MPIRSGADGALEVLLLTSRESKRWVIPKGWPMKGKKPWEAAAIEALEEAGIEGKPSKTSLGRYTYFKRQEAHFEVCDVDVYALSFTKQRASWREQGQREAKWCGLEEAGELVEEPGLKALLLGLIDRGFPAPKARKKPVS